MQLYTNGRKQQSDTWDPHGSRFFITEIYAGITYHKGRMYAVHLKTQGVPRYSKATEPISFPYERIGLCVWRI